MKRMLTLIWALGAVSFTSQAQAVAPMGELGGSAGAAMISSSKMSTIKIAHLTSDQATTSTYKSRRVGKAAAQKRRVSRKHHRAARSRVSTRSVVAQRSRQAKRRNAGSYAYRSRRITEDAAPAKVAQSASRARKRSARSAPVGARLTGMASYYWQPQRVASGGWFNPKAMTAAHKTLPFGTRVRVTNKRNGRSVEVTINDRGPYVGGRIIDLSDAAAGAIGMKKAGVVPVEVEVVGR